MTFFKILVFENLQMSVAFTCFKQKQLIQYQCDLGLMIS